MNAKDIRRLVFLLTQSNLSYNVDGKAEFARLGKRLLKALAEKLGLVPGTYDVRFNPGGIAVSGECTLHAEGIYVQLYQSCVSGSDHFFFRSCKGRKDYTGGRNNWMAFRELLDLDKAAARIASVVFTPSFVCEVEL